MLDCPQKPVSLRKLARDGVVEPVGGEQRVDRIKRGWRSNRRIAPAMDHLLDLDKEFDLADPAAPALQVIARSNMSALREMVANTCRDLPHFVDHPEIER